MRSRPRTKFVKQLKSRRCGKCGTLLNNQRTRCPRCGSLAGRPTKSPTGEPFRRRRKRAQTA